MTKEYAHSFKVVGADRAKPSITSWKIQTPESNTKEYLRINFNEFIDYGSLKDASGAIVTGDFIMDVNQKFAIFKPVQNWDKGTYTIKCEPIIEDLAGNNLERLFDRDITVEREIPVLELFFDID